MTEQALRLIVGLGNPDSQYAGNRHNVGVWFVHQLIAKYQISLHHEAKFKGLVCKIADLQGVFCLCPTTFMNNSGEAVRAIASFYQIEPGEILVVHDDLDFLPGVIKLKYAGGSGGHNGLRSIISHLHNEEFYRLRLGIGRPLSKELVSDYVLGNPSNQEAELINKAIALGLTFLPQIIAGNMQSVMQNLSEFQN